MIRKLRGFMKGSRGQGMSEYIIMVGLVAIAAIGIYTAFGDQVRSSMQAIGTQLSGDESASQELDAGLADQAGKDVSLSDFGGNSQ
jgi:Flp pilus assembly pilin Flp